MDGGPMTDAYQPLKDGGSTTKFLNYVATLLIKKYKTLKKDPKKLHLTLSQAQYVGEEIKNFCPDRYKEEMAEDARLAKEAAEKEKKLEAERVQEKKKRVATGEESTAKQNDDAELVQDVNPKKKKGPRSKAPVTPILVTVTNAAIKSQSTQHFSGDEETRTKAVATYKAEFEAQKAEILDELDDDYTQHFGKIAFRKWKKDPYRPGVILSPFSVPQKLRNDWFKMYDNVSIGRTSDSCMSCFW